MFFAVAIVVTIGASVPAHQAQAGWFSLDIFDSMAKWLAKLATGDNVLIRFLYAVIGAVLSIALDAISLLVYFGAWLVDVMLHPAIYVGDPGFIDPDTGNLSPVLGVLNSQTVDTGWRTVRDMCNTFFIFFLLLIAFSAILRVQKFGSTKTLLVKFIMAIFLINFSAVIAKIIIDVGQVFMYEIIAWMPGGFEGKAGSLTSVVDRFKSEVNWGWQYSFEDLVKAALAVAYSAMLGLIYIMLAGFLLVRLVMFVILIILSPFAFLSLVLPSMSKYTSEWFDSIVKYSIFGPVFLFFIYLSATMANELVSSGVPHRGTDKIGAISEIVILMIPNVVALCMLYAVIPITQRLGVAGSKQFIGGTMGLGKIAMGTYGGIKLAGGFGKKAVGETVGKSKAVRKAQDSLTRTYHKGLASAGFRGTAIQKKAAYERKKEERMKEKEGKYGDLKSIDLNILESKAKSRVSGTKEDKALWLKAAATQGKLGDEKYKDTVKEFMKYGEHAMSKKEVDEITDKSLTLATQTRESQDRIKNRDYKSFSDEAQQRIRDNGGDEKAFREEIMREKMNDLVEDGKTHKLQDLKNGETAKIYDEILSKDQKKSDMNRMSKKQKDELAEGYMANTLSAADYATATAEQKKEDLKYKINAVNVGKELTEAFASGGADAAKDIEKAFSKFDTKRIAKFTEQELKDYGYAANTSQLRSMNRDGKQDELKIIKESKEMEKSRIETDPDKVEKHNKLEKDIDNIDSMISGEKY